LAAEESIATWHTPASPSGDAGTERWRIPAAQLRRMLAAAMLGMAVFLVQAGTVELILRGDRMCQQERAANWAFNPKGCQPEAVRYLLQGLSHGPLGALQPDLPAALGVITMAALIGIVAAFLGLLPLRQSIPAFLVLEALAALVFGMVGYLLLFIG